MTLYRETQPTRCSAGLRNRRRVWNLISSLTKSLGLQRPEVSHADLETAQLRWCEVTGDLRHKTATGEYADFNQGCRIRDSKAAFIPEGLSKIGFSIIGDGDAGYLAGMMRVINERGSDVCLGYISKGNELFHEVTELGGFILAVGSRGIKALQVVSRIEIKSEWFGCPENTPKTERLAGIESIVALQVGYDVSVLRQLSPLPRLVLFMVLISIIGI